MTSEEFDIWFENTTVLCGPTVGYRKLKDEIVGLTDDLKGSYLTDNEKEQLKPVLRRYVETVYNKINELEEADQGFVSVKYSDILYYLSLSD